MAPKTSLMLIAFGMICLLQTIPPTAAANKHVKQLLRTFRKIDFDSSKKSFYLHSAKYGLQVHLREPLIKRALGLLPSSILSKTCLKQMARQVRDLERTFYAGFSYGCEIQDQQYTVECLEAARPAYLTGLQQLRKDTEACLQEH